MSIQVKRGRKLSLVGLFLAGGLVLATPVVAYAASTQYASAVPKTAYSAIYPAWTGTLSGGKASVPTSVWFVNKAVSSLEYGYEYWRASGTGSSTVSGTHLPHGNSRSMCSWWGEGASVPGTVPLSCWRYTP